MNGPPAGVSMVTLPVICGPPATSLFHFIPLSSSHHFFHFPQAPLVKRECAQRGWTRTTKPHISASIKDPKSTEGPNPSTMTEAAHLVSLKPHLPTDSSMTFDLLPSTTTLLPWEEVHMQVHTILIVVIFCVVCVLLLLSFFYAFCLHCSIDSSTKDSHRGNRGSPEREDATYRRSSSDNQSVGNTV